MVRYEPKKFNQRRPDGCGGWIWNLQGVRRVLYRLPRVLQAACAHSLVYVVEGEKDVHTLEGWDMVATTNAGGAEKWSDDFSDSMTGAHVVVLPDNDDAGRKHAQKVAESLQGKVASIKIVDLPGLPAKGDVTDWMQSGGTAEQLAALVNAAPEWVSVVSVSRPDRASEDPYPEFDGPPRSLQADLVPVPALLAEMLPSSLRGWLWDIKERVGCPLEYPTATAIIALGTVIGRRVGIRPKRYDDWIVVPNLWGAIVGRPGSLKSPAIAEALKPLLRMEMQALEAHRQETDIFHATQLVAKAKAEAAKDRMKREARKAEPDEESLKDLSMKALRDGQEQPPTLKRLIINDTTVEALSDRLRENPNGLLVFRDELPGLLSGLERVTSLEWCKN